MPDAKKSIVLLAFQFPPYADVGANRWGGLAPAIAKLGYDLTVVTVNWGGNRDFYNKVFPGLRVVFSKSGFLHRLRMRQFNRYVSAVRNLIFRPFERWFYFHDYAQRWRALEALEEVWQQNPFSILIATGAPFHANVLAQKFKEKHPQVFLIHDLRDIWADNPYAWSGPIKDKVQQLEREAMVGADRVVTISEALTQFYRQKYPGQDIRTVENGFSERIFFPLPKSESHKQVFLHAGNLTNGREKALYPLLDVMQDSPELWSKIQIRLVGAISHRTHATIHAKYRSMLDGGALVIRSRVPREALMNEFRLATHGLLLNSSQLEYALSTKLYEYAALHIPVFSLHFGGEIEKFLKSVNWGVSINLQSPGELQGAIRGLMQNSQPEYDFSTAEEFSFPKLANKYEKNLI